MLQDSISIRLRGADRFFCQQNGFEHPGLHHFQHARPLQRPINMVNTAHGSRHQGSSEGLTAGKTPNRAVIEINLRET
jgi:hypothetical protein